MDGAIFDRIARGVAALAALLGLGCGIADADSPAPTSGASQSVPDLAAALGRTRTQGVPTILVATSGTSPESKAFWRELVDSPWARTHRGLVQFVEMPIEAVPTLVEKLQIRSTPTVVAYVAGTDGPTCRGKMSSGSLEEVTAWLESLGQDGGRPAGGEGLDPAVVQAGHHPGYPSAQQPLVPQAMPPAPPIPVTSPAVPAFAPPAAPVASFMVPQAASAPASFVQVPGPNVVVQQGEARVFVTQAAPAAMSFVPQAVAPAGNMFLPSAAPAMAAPAFAAPMATVPVAAAMAPAAAPAATAFAAVTNQTLALPTSRSTTRVRVRGPGLLRSGLASLGERLVLLGRARIETIQETELDTPASQGGGVATFSTASAIPQAVPQLSTMAAPQPAQPVQYEYSAPPTPSPQGTSRKHHHFKK